MNKLNKENNYSNEEIIKNSDIENKFSNQVKIKKLNQDIDNSKENQNYNYDIIKLNNDNKISNKEIIPKIKDDKISNKVISQNLNNKSQIQNQQIKNFGYNINNKLNPNIQLLNKENIHENLNKEIIKNSYMDINILNKNIKSNINKTINSDLNDTLNKDIINNSFNYIPQKIKKDNFHLSNEDILINYTCTNNSYDTSNIDSNSFKLNTQNEKTNIKTFKRSITSRIMKHNIEKLKDIQTNKRIFSLTKVPKRKKVLNPTCKRILENPQKYFTTTLTGDMIKALGLDKKYLLDDTI